MFNNIIIIGECNQGQKKDGVQNGGRYICKSLDLKPNDTFLNSMFLNIESTEYNGYEKISHQLEKYNNDKYNNTINKSKKNISILIGGDHSLGISSVDAYLNIYGDELSVLWIDAHADINDHLTSLSGNLHGMTLGYHHISRADKPIWRKNPKKLKSSQLYYFGIRDLDPAEVELINKENIGFSLKPDNKLKNFINNSKYLLISFDVDALDPEYMDSTGVIASNGLTPNEVKQTIEYAYEQNKLVHLDIMEFNPLLGNAEKSIQSVKEIFS
jgi:arginase